ncbi:DUF4255 domain-containing protein [Prosthecobacter sp.]|jgi:hypothetical protein|uniref:DUF4255 domain-containing protein n=1 Tax=Prosthecobacter sp. TaxID=1965333 RepID=UPI0037CB3B02
MIQEALKAVVGDLNAALRRQRGDSRDRVILDHLSKAGAEEADDHICCMLTQITEEKNIANVATPRQAPEAMQHQRPPVILNLQLLFAAQYTRYEVGLEMISQVIAYLHAKPLFTPANTPTMHRGLDRLTLEMYSLNSSEQSALWSMLGEDYVPSVLYSMRMLTFGGSQISALDPSVNPPAAAGGAVST